MSSEAKEKRFLDALESLFTGAEVDGDSGFINLMRLKRGYFKSLRPKLMAAIDARAAKDTAFREELFDKLHTFFSRYFCESGSILSISATITTVFQETCKKLVVLSFTV